MDRLKSKIWKFIYIIFPIVQDSLLKCKIIWHSEERQPYHIGWLSRGKTIEELKEHLKSNWNFGNHFIAWKDTGQVLSYRRLVSFKYQYHLRIFEDGEIRGHYELTPESHPIDHFLAKGELDKKSDFLNFLGDFVTSEKTISNIKINSSFSKKEPQISFKF